MRFPIRLRRSDQEFVGALSKFNRRRTFAGCHHLVAAAILFLGGVVNGYLAAQLLAENPTPVIRHEFLLGIFSSVILALPYLSLVLLAMASSNARVDRLLLEYWERRPAGGDALCTSVDEQHVATIRTLLPRQPRQAALRWWLFAVSTVIWVVYVHWLIQNVADDVFLSGGMVGGSFLLGMVNLLLGVGILARWADQSVFLLLRLWESEQRATPADQTAMIYCRSCGYCLRGAGQARCPECGHAFDRRDPHTFSPTARGVVVRQWLRRARFAALALAGLALAFVLVYAGWFAWRHFEEQGAIALAEAHGSLVDKSSTSRFSPESVFMVDAPVVPYGDSDLAVFAGSRRLEFLDLVSSQITDQGLKHLAGLPRMRRLLLARTQVTDDGLRALTGLTNLGDLSLDETAVQGSGLSHLSRLPDFNALSLRAAQLHDDGLAGIGRCTNLVRVDLSQNAISDRGLSHLGTLRLLRLLDLSQTQVRGPGLASLNCVQVFRLRLGQTPLEDAGLAALARMPNLYILDLHQTKITDAGLAHLTALAKLRRLRLDGTAIGDAGVAMLPASLASLSLTGTPISDAALTTVAQRFSELRKLCLGSTRVSDQGIAALTPLAHLKELDLSQIQLSDELLAQTLSIKSLRVLSLCNTALTDDGMENFRRARVQAATQPDPSSDSLIALNLARTRITNRALQGSLPDLLEILDLSHTQVTDEGLPFLPAHLTALSLAHTKVTDEGVASLPRLIHRLDLSHTQISDRGLAALAKLPELFALDLSHTQITDADLVHLEASTSLCYLVVAGTNVTEQGALHLQQALASQGRTAIVRRDATQSQSLRYPRSFPIWPVSQWEY